MLLQTNSYVVPKEKRAEHARLLRRFRQSLARLGCTDFEVYEQVGNNWSADQSGGRFVQIMRFRDRKHQLAVLAAEREDPVAQALVAEFCELINFPYQQENNLFAVGYYTALLGPASHRSALPEEHQIPPRPGARPVTTPVPPAAFSAYEPPEPLPDSEPDLSKLAQEFIRSARPHADVHADTGPTLRGISAPDQDEIEREPVTEPSEPAEHEPQPGGNGNGKYEFQIPQYASAWGDEDVETPASPGPVPANEEPVPTLDELLDLEIGQTAASDEARLSAEPAPEGESSGIGDILSASLADDELDIALPAELVDPTELNGFPHDSDHPIHADPLDHQSR